MKLLGPAQTRPARRGSALLMAFLMLIVLAAILYQLSIGTSTDARVARNDVTLTAMDQAIESALLEVMDRLAVDAEAGGEAGGEAGAGPGGAPGGPEAPSAGLDAAAGPGGSEAGGSVDSREDSWGKPQRTTINEIELRILVQDEDAKINVLQLLTEDPEERDKASERIVRVLDLCREDTSLDIDLSDARRMVEAMREHLEQRQASLLPRTPRLSDDEEKRDRGLPMTLREFVVLEPFYPGLFRDSRDDLGRIVHSIGSFLTVSTSLATVAEVNPPEEGESPSGPLTGAQRDAQEEEQEAQASETEGEGAEGEDASDAGTGGSSKGVAVNINTAPAAVLKSLLDDRVVPYRFWDDVIEFRNEEREPEEDAEDVEPVYDEFGNEVVALQYFESTSQIEDLRNYDRISAEARLELAQYVKVDSEVFSVFITARRSSNDQDDFGGVRGARRRGERDDERGDAMTRTVRCLLWRKQVGEEWKLVPLVRWEVLDYTPFEVQDFPDPDR